MCFITVTTIHVHSDRGPLLYIGDANTTVITQVSDLTEILTILCKTYEYELFEIKQIF